RSRSRPPPRGNPPDAGSGSGAAGTRPRRARVSSRRRVDNRRAARARAGPVGSPRMLLSSLCCALLCAPDVVELKDGTRLIGEIAASKETVTFRTPLGSLEVPALDVVRQQRRNELLPKHRALAAGAGDEVRAWLTVATWDLQHGLYPEAFDAADRAAALAPKDPAVVTLFDQLTREALLDESSPQDAPAVEPRGRLLERIAGKSPARGAFARAALGRVTSDELEPWLLAQLKSARPESRAGAARLLGDFGDEKALAQLIRSSLVDEHC